MNTLKLQFRGNTNTDSLTLLKYEVDPSLKEKFFGEKANDVENIDVKIDDVKLSYVSDSFKIKYSRYINCRAPNSNIESIKNVKTGNFPTNGNVFKKELLCHFLLNFVNLSYGNELDISRDIYSIPVEFFQGKSVIDSQFKFFLEYDDGSACTDTDSITIIFRII